MSQFLHSEAWQRLEAREGLRPLRKAGQLFSRHQLPFGEYLSGARISLDAEHGLPVPNGAIFARIEPLDESSLQALKKLGTTVATTAVQPRQSSLVDIAMEPEAILAGFESKHRYNVRLAERKGVEVGVYGADQLPRFLALLHATAKRQDFRLHREEHYRLMGEELGRDGMFHLLLASKDGEDLAGLLLITCGDTATYLHGASSDQNKNLMAPHLLHWQAILHAKGLGCTIYDLWGTHAARNAEGNWEPIAGHASAGVTRFKLGFGGRIVEYPGAYDLIFQPFWYTAYTMLRRIRSRKRAFS